MKIMTREKFAALASGQYVDAYITFNHGAALAAIHHDVRNASVRYILSLYPVFDSIRITRVIVPQMSVYAGDYAKTILTHA